MGMAASQARYLALTARKTNTEWEGQQINQARTALANQSANLFNRLLDMEVPNPPKETDYTEVQYSYDDGDNEAVIEKWEHLGTNNGDYNYVVKHYYMADIFTGIRKQLQDPQVQLGDVLKKLEYESGTTTVVQEGDGITVKYKAGNNFYETQYQKITEATATDECKKQLTSFENAMGFAKSDGTLNYDPIYGYVDSNGTWHFFVANKTEDTDKAAELRTELTAYETAQGMLNPDGSLNFDYVYGKQEDDGSWSLINNKNYPTKITKSLVEEDDDLKTALTAYEAANNLLAADGTLTYHDIYASKDAEGNWSFMNTRGYDKITEDKATPYLKAYDNIDYSTAYNSPAFVGNSKLTELNKLIVNKEQGIDQVADLAQILRDCPTDAINQYVHFDNNGNLIYNGSGIYTFEINGKSYYTTQTDLMNSFNTTTKALNGIDVQSGLNYYNAYYINKKVEETNNALLETDGKGRFTSVRFDNSSATYSLNFEEVTNEAAYQDAMNQYLYKKAQYEKTIADINAKTSIIQKEDRTLELRLKQLDTEQNALATEMDAVKKVIKDNVEKTFKTFSD